MMIKNASKKLKEYVNKKGLDGLLPQNLPQDIFERMHLETISVENRTIDFPATTLLLAVILLQKSEQKIGKDFDLTFKDDEFMEKFNLYLAAIKIEDLRREKIIFVSADSLPTIENLLDYDRELTISRLN